MGIAKLSSGLGALLALFSVVLTVISVILPWWHGSVAGQVANVREEPAVDSIVTLWDHQITLRIDTPEGDSTLEVLNWTSWQQTADEYYETVPGLAETFGYIIAVRAFAIGSAIFSFFAVLVNAIAFKVLPLVSVFAAGIETLSLACMGGVGVYATQIATSGISTGIYLAFASVLCRCGCILMSLYASAKAVKEEAKDKQESIGTTSRQERFRLSKDKSEQARKEREKMFSAAAKEEKRPASAGTAEGAGEDVESNQKPVPASLKKVFFWKQEVEENGAEEEIPNELLEFAFREIDEDDSGNIEIHELLDGFRRCGLPAQEEAVANVMKEIDKNQSGDIDLHEFVEFFRHIEELDRFQKKSEQRAQFAAFLLNCCFLTDIIVVAVLLFIWIKMPDDTQRDTQVIVQNVLMGLTCVLIALFLCVVGMPAARLTLGPTMTALDVKYQEFVDAYKNRKKRPPEEVNNDNGPSYMPRDPVTAPAHPALMAASYRFVGQSRDMVAFSEDYSDNRLTSRLSHDVNNPPDRRSIKDQTGQMRQSTRSFAALSEHSRDGNNEDIGIMDPATGALLRYNPNNYVQQPNRFMSSFSPLQARTGYETALMDAQSTYMGQLTTYGSGATTGDFTGTYRNNRPLALGM